jgi:hypothetical protein
MHLINSPSYPSGHTTYGYTGSVMVAPRQDARRRLLTASEHRRWCRAAYGTDAYDGTSYCESAHLSTGNNPDRIMRHVIRDHACEVRQMEHSLSNPPHGRNTGNKRPADSAK